MMSERPTQPTVAERIKKDEAIESFFATFMEAVKKTSSSRFSDNASAVKAADHFRNSTIHKMNELEVGRLNFILQFDGAGVMVPNIDIVSSDEGVRFDIDKDEPYSQKEPFEDVKGVITALLTPIKEYEDGTFSFQPVFLCKDAKLHTMDLGISDKLPLGNITMNALIQVWCQEDTRITIPSLDEAREQQRAIAVLDAHCHPKIVKSARRLQQAFLDEDPEMFKELRNTALLRKIAYKTLEHIGHAEIIAEGMAGIIGRKRNLRITGVVFESVSDKPTVQSLTGSVVDVLPLNPQSRQPEPTIVLETNKDGQDSFYYAPFSAIKQLRY